MNVLKIDIVGYWPGTMAQPGAEVSEQDEDDPDKLMVGVNDDDDNRDEVVDNDRASSSTIAAEDDEILTFTLTCAHHEGQVELSVEGSGIRIFDESGQNQIPLPVTVVPAQRTVQATGPREPPRKAIQRLSEAVR